MVKSDIGKWMNILHDDKCKHIIQSVMIVTFLSILTVF